jgi:tetratricopeptide (TPR) repeat protein
MPSFKEPQYLVRNEVKGRLHKSISNRNEYFSLFDDATEKNIGEASVFYLYFYEEAIKNIKEELGDDVKIIIVLREPVSRAISAYEHVFRNNLDEKLSFQEAIDCENMRLQDNPNITPMVMYKQMGLYSKAVQSYKKAFKDVHILIYDDFCDNPKSSIEQIFDFLKIPPFHQIDFNSKQNLGGWQWQNNFIKKIALNNNNLLKNLLKFIVPKKARKGIFNIIKNNTINAEKVKIQQSTKEDLKKYYKTDIEKLEKIINKDLSKWLI